MLIGGYFRDILLHFGVRGYFIGCMDEILRGEAL